MSIEGIFYVLVHVSDLARSKKFYGETLGWELGTDEEHVAGFSFGSGYLVVHDDEREGADRRYAGGMAVSVKVSDIEAEYARLRDEGVEVGELATRPWGERNFHFTDPDGYGWFYAQA